MIQRRILSRFSLIITKVVVSMLIGAGMAVIAFLMTTGIVKGLTQISADLSSSTTIDNPLTSVIFLMTGCIITIAYGIIMCVIMNMIFGSIYTSLGQMITKIIVVNVLLIFPFAAMYFISLSSFEFLYLTLMCHVTIGIYCTFMIIDSSALPMYIIVHLLGYTMGLVSILLIIMALLKFGSSNANSIRIMLMTVMPCIATTIMSVSHGLWVLLYSKIAEGSRDFLAIAGIQLNTHGTVGVSDSTVSTSNTKHNHKTGAGSSVNDITI